MDNRMGRYFEDLKQKNVIVVGMGKSGKAAAMALNEIGCKVSCMDSNSLSKLSSDIKDYMAINRLRVFLGGDEPKSYKDFDMMVLSPGVPLDKKFVQDAIKDGCEIIGELELAYRLSNGKYVAITGTNGKTTTTALTGEIFEAAGRNTNVVGNIGNPVITAVMESRKSNQEEWFVAEASSFQLETVSEFRPVVSAILNLTPDHLNRHKTMEAYGSAKANIAAAQTEDDFIVLNKDDEESYKLGARTKAKIFPFSRKEILEYGAFLDDNELVIKDFDGTLYKLCSRDELRIIGDHNVENALAAAAISFCSGIEVETIASAIKVFCGVEHRIEYSGTIDGVDYYNDSKGTNVDAAVIALKALKDNIILIAGGDGKAQDFTDFAKAMPGKVKALVLLGRDAHQIEEAARREGFSEIYNESCMKDCVRKCYELASAGDKVLLSPACASWDMYPSYEVRGRDFKDCVKELEK